MSIIGTEFQVLDHGFIRVVDLMGDDSSIVEAARVSYGKGTKSVRDNEALIRFLMRHRHTSPFEMCEIKLHVKVPMDCWRQWIRHRTASVNESSSRFSEVPEENQQTKATDWRRQGSLNKQNSQGFVEVLQGERLSIQEQVLQEHAWRVYNDRLAAGVAREQARKDLPLSTYTAAYWKIDLHNLLHFLELRMAENAQREIREYANVIGYEIVSQWCPLTWQAFLDYRVNSMSLSAIEQQIIVKKVKGENIAELVGSLGKSERADFLAKLKKLGL